MLMQVHQYVLTYNHKRDVQERVVKVTGGDAMKAQRREAQAPTFPSEKRIYVHSLSLRLTDELYRQLRRFVIGHEDRTGQRLTHQAVIEAALADYLNR